MFPLFCFLLVLLKTLIRVYHGYIQQKYTSYFNGNIVFSFIVISLASIRIQEKGGIKEDQKLFVLSNEIDSFVIC